MILNKHRRLNPRPSTMPYTNEPKQYQKKTIKAISSLKMYGHGNAKNSYQRLKPLPSLINWRMSFIAALRPVNKARAIIA